MLDVLFKVWPIVATIGSIIGTLGMAWLSRKFVPMTEHNKVVNTVMDMNQRLRDAELHLKAMPSRDELHRLDKTLEGLGARFGAMEQGINHIRNNVDMLIQNELEGERRGDR
ncbi:DUF2730 family protein [Shewanella yunxiaonensis]|uniref:DUF2730 family protein n=1 Tax=Shewanella yunxiaonensis TaxID=2829809 RepID=A0ABX7YVC3_9GAMM|nr:DUF2730 family protein [Shewanella yunxiaonensis]QUN06443.1 DUF2730 family protein [Shewanella yunxiaonensis]